MSLIDDFANTLSAAKDKVASLLPSGNDAPAPPRVEPSLPAPTNPAPPSPGYTGQPSALTGGQPAPAPATPQPAALLRQPPPSPGIQMRAQASQPGAALSDAVTARNVPQGVRAAAMSAPAPDVAPSLADKFGAADLRYTPPQPTPLTARALPGGVDVAPAAPPPAAAPAAAGNDGLISSLRRAFGLDPAGAAADGAAGGIRGAAINTAKVGGRLVRGAVTGGLATGLAEGGAKATNFATNVVASNPDPFADNGTIGGAMDPDGAFASNIIKAARDNPVDTSPQPFLDGLKRLAGDNPITDYLRGSPTPAAAPVAAPDVAAAAAAAPATPVAVAETKRLQTQAGAPASTPAVAPQASQISDLQQQQDAGPIARVALGGGGSVVYYKDGTQQELPVGQQMPDDVAQYLHRGAMIDSLGTDANGATGPAGSGTYAHPSGYVPFANHANEAERRNLQIYGHAVGSAEGADYNTLVGGKKFSDYSQHPGIVGVTTPDGPSTAAGKYQITGTTFKSLQQQDPLLKDFSPQSQDAAFEALLARHGALVDVKNGNFDAATAKLGNEWQGLPSGASKNQGKRTPEQFAQMIKDATAAVDGGQAPVAGAVAPTIAAAAPGNAPVAAAPTAPVASTATVPVENAAAPTGVANNRQPVQIIKGMQQTTAIPNDKGGYDIVPRTIYDAGQDATKNYIASEIQGSNFANNPVAGKIAEEAARAKGLTDVANIQAQAGNKRFITAGGGVNPETGMMNPTTIFDTQTGKDATAPQDFPEPPPQAIDDMKAKSSDPVAVKSFVNHFGHARYQQFLKTGK